VGLYRWFKFIKAIPFQGVLSWWRSWYIIDGKGFKEVLNWIFPTGMDCGCVLDVLRGEDLRGRKAGVCPLGQIGLYVFFRESQEHVLPNEEFFPI